MDEAARKAKAVGQAHTAKEYRIHDAIVRDKPGTTDDAAWSAAMSLPAKARGRRPKR